MFIQEMYPEMKLQIPNVLPATAVVVARQGSGYESNTIKDGKCSKCGSRIEGVWN